MIGAILDLKSYLDRVRLEIERLDLGPIHAMADLIHQAWESGRWVYVIGNGGSGANASHLCEDLAKCPLKDFENQKRLRIMSLTDNTPAIMAWANDTSYDRIFLEQLKTYAAPGDLLLAISGSGNSPNILKAVDWANANGMTTIGITGFSGGKLREIAHHDFHVDIHDMGVVESIHLVVFHWLIDDLYRRISGTPDPKLMRACGLEC
jgi:D-sedoheptulose 7-phosphate isomerase